MKKCIECGEVKSLSDFYKNGRMADGHLNKCKECVKSAVTRYRNKNIDKVRAYDRARGNRQDPSYIKEYRARYPKKYRANMMVQNQVRRGNLVSCPCEVCGSDNTGGHHDDYDKPLNVRWLCQAHHMQWHVKNGQGLNAT